MDNELSVVTHIKKYGLEETISKFKLKSRNYPHKILLKYNQIDSDMSFSEVQDCRGLVLEKDTWKVISLAFRKFFNSAETQAAKVDWLTAYIFEKVDGSLIQLYWDWVLEKWCAGTTGMAEGEGEVNDRPNTSFNELFWETLKKYDFNVDSLEKGYTYVFELMTPYNIVVNPHGESKVALLAIRNLTTLEELDYETIASKANNEWFLPTVEIYKLNARNAGHLMATFEHMPAFDEGYVVCDANFNRIKIKNPKYVALHHLKGKAASYRIMTIIKSNEVEEFGVSFPERIDEINKLVIKYENLLLKLESGWGFLKERKPKNITKYEQKRFAFEVFELVKKENLNGFSGMFFSLKDNKVDSVKEFLMEYSDKKLYDMFTLEE